jgi:predicted Zn-dependent peptidase
MLFAVMLVGPQQAAASEQDETQYAPAWVYEVEHYKLPNGMNVVLKDHDQISQVSIRLIVGYGSWSEPCGQQETAHFLEHLLFAGTSKHTETELDRLIDSWGGSWNAITYNDRTVYEIDLYSGHQKEGLEILHEILTDSQFNQENVDKSRDIIHREAGGEYSKFTQFFVEKGIFKNSEDQMREDMGMECGIIELASNIKRPDIIKAHETWYVPNNMSLIVTGKISPAIREQISLLFGGLESKPLPEKRLIKGDGATDHDYRGTFAPPFGDETDVMVAYMLGAYDLRERYVAWVLANFLGDRIFEEVRIEDGMSYSPYADYIWSIRHNYGYFYVGTDVNNEDAEKGEQRLLQFLDEFIEKGMTQEDFDKTTHEMLLRMAGWNYTNVELADYYTNSQYFFKRNGYYPNPETMITSFTVDDVNNFVNKYMRTQPIMLVDKPTLSLNQFWALIIGGPILVIVLVVYIVLRHRKKASH